VSHEWSFENNPFRKAAMALRQNPWPTRGALTRADGRFSIVVPPGPGFLLVKAAEPDFVHVETSTGRLDGAAGGTPWFVDAAVPVAYAPAAPPQECAVPLRRGITVRGRVVGSGGRPVASGVLVSPTYIPEGMELKGHALPVRDGRFELPGLAPGSTTTVVFFDRRTREGAVAVLSALGGPEPEVRLGRSVSARLRIAGPAEKSAAVPRFSTALVFRPGPTANETFATGEVAGLTVRTERVFGAENRPVKEHSGDYLVPILIPGASYTVRVDVPGFRPATANFKAPPAGSGEPTVVVLEPKAEAPRQNPPGKK
jgi:hypothetical protein